MSSVAVQAMPSAVNGFSRDSIIANKLASDLDSKLLSSSKQVLLHRIEFKPATKPDEQYENLKRKYVPLNSQRFNSSQYTNGHSKESLLRTSTKDENEDLPSPKVVLYPVEKVELSWKQIRRIGPGLNNLGNTCFLNSVLQVLTYTAPLVNYLLSQEHSGKCRTVGFCMLCELQRHILRTFNHHQGEAIKPMAIIQKLKFIAKHLRFGHQEDAHELLRYIVDGMQKSCLAAEGYTENLDRISKQTTMVQQVFGGYYRSQVRCLKCKNNSNTFDPLMEIMLDIKHAPSVEKALQKFIKMELLDGENLYMCPRCKRKVPANKQVLVHRAPNILTIQLKRFDCNQIFGGKVSKHVDYTEHLNLRPYMTSQGPPVRYRLFAVLLHSGYSCNSGHYYCYVKASNGTWYQMNDSSVQQAGLKVVLSQQAYLLFYSKIAKQESQSSLNGMTSPQTMRTPGGSKGNFPTIIRQNSNGTPVKPGIYFKQFPNSTSTVTKLTTPSNTKPPVPLKLAAEREKFSFNFPAKNKVQEADRSKTKDQGNKNQDEVYKGKDRKSDDSEKLGTPGKEVIGPVAMSPVSTADKKLHVSHEQTTSAVPDSLSKPTQPQSSAVKEYEGESARPKELSDKGFPLKKEEKGKSLSPVCKKPRPPPLFIPRVVAQGKQTPHSAARATTPWKVTPKTTSEPVFGPMSPPPPGVAPPQPSPQSAMSDTSSTSSMVGKTGDWTVSDKMNLTPGPRLPERQHAGWKVSDRSVAEDELKTGNDDEQESAAENGEEKGKTKTKKKTKKEKKKRKKKDKKYSTLSEPENEEEETKDKKHSHKYDKHAGDKGAKQEFTVEEERKKKHKRKRKAIDNDGEVDISKKQRLVAYDESSSSSVDESNIGDQPAKAASSNTKSASNKCTAPVIYDGEPRKESSRRAAWDGSRDSSTVNELLNSKGGLHGYGDSVLSWDGGKNVIDSSVGETDRKRDRRDSWDEDYDRGKEKKVKSKRKENKERHHTDYNPFQREYEKKTIKGFRERFSRQGSRNHHSHQHSRSRFRSQSSRKYHRLSH